MTEHAAPDEVHKESLQELATAAGTMSIQPKNEIEDPMAPAGAAAKSDQSGPAKVQKAESVVSPCCLTDEIICADPF